MSEKWRPVVGHADAYEVSSHGRVRSIPHKVPCAKGKGWRMSPGKLLAPFRTALGYLAVSFVIDGKARQKKVHRLVLLAFVGGQPEGMEACHNDGDKENNRLENLRWDTRAANTMDKRRHGTILYGEAVASAKLSESAVASIRAAAGRATEIAAVHGVTDTCIRHVRQRKTWRHV